MPMRVVVASPYPADDSRVNGGVEAVILYLVRSLANFNDLNINVVTINNNISKEKTVTNKNVTIHYIPSSKMPARLSLLANVNRIKKKIIQLNPEIVHAQIAGIYAKAAERSGYPWVVTLHGIRFLEAELWTGFINKIYRSRAIKFEEAHVIKKAKHIISINPFVIEKLGPYIKGEVYDIENPIDKSYFELPIINAKQNQILFAGRLIPRKGVITLLKAFKKVKSRISQVKLRLAGGGISAYDPSSYYKSIIKYIKYNDLEDSVDILGELNEHDLRKEYEECSLFVLSSVLETAPMVITQALAAGKPVVTTDAGGAKYLVEENKTGFVVPCNDENKLAAAIENSLSQPIKLEQMGENARKVAKNRFHSDVIAEQTRELYYKLVGRNITNS